MFSSERCLLILRYCKKAWEFMLLFSLRKHSSLKNICLFNIVKFLTHKSSHCEWSVLASDCFYLASSIFDRLKDGYGMENFQCHPCFSVAFFVWCKNMHLLKASGESGSLFLKKLQNKMTRCR